MLDDHQYYSARAEQQLQLAQKAPDSSIGNIHYQLVDGYLSKLIDLEECDSGSPIDCVYPSVS